jgi:hypothetical protein
MSMVGCSRREPVRRSAASGAAGEDIPASSHRLDLTEACDLPWLSTWASILAGAIKSDFSEGEERWSTSLVLIFKQSQT